MRDALRRILDSPDFEVTERNRRFLSYVVEETLAGRAKRIKGYTIAVSVFNRGESFDAISDPLIRIQAGRLRYGLEHYYLTAGCDDPVRITIPIGCYVPHFLAVWPPQAEAEPDPGRESLGHRLPVHLKAIAVCGGLVLALTAGLWLRPHATPARPAEHVTAHGDRASVPVRGTAILVLPFAKSGSHAGSDASAEILRERIIDGLTRFEDLVVLGPTGTLPVSAPAGTIAADYVLQGTVHAIGADLHIFVLLIEPRQNRYVWADTLDRPLAEGEDAAAVDAAAGQIVRELAQPYGAIFVDKVRTAGTQSPERVPEE